MVSFGHALGHALGPLTSTTCITLRGNCIHTFPSLPVPAFLLFPLIQTSLQMWSCMFTPRCIPRFICKRLHLGTIWGSSLGKGNGSNKENGKWASKNEGSTTFQCRMGSQGMEPLTSGSRIVSMPCGCCPEQNGTGENGTHNLKAQNHRYTRLLCAVMTKGVQIYTVYDVHIRRGVNTYI